MLECNYSINAIVSGITILGESMHSRHCNTMVNKNQSIRMSLKSHFANGTSGPRDNTQHISAPCISQHCVNVHQCHRCTYTMGTNVHHTMTCTPKVAAGMHLARRGVGGAWLPCQPFTKFQTFKCRCKKKSDK